MAEEQPEEQIELDPVVVVARITTLEMLVRQMMVVQLRLLAERGHIELTPAYVQSLADAYAEKVDESTIIESKHYGIPADNNAVALLLFLLAAPVFSGFIAPLMAQSSRKHEFEADAYAVQHTRAQDLQSALLKLYEDNASTLTPDPLYVRYYYSHPPAVERISHMQQLTP